MSQVSLKTITWPDCRSNPWAPEERDDRIEEIMTTSKQTIKERVPSLEAALLSVVLEGLNLALGNSSLSGNSQLRGILELSSIIVI